MAATELEGLGCGEPGDVFSENEMDETEWTIRNALLGMVAQTIFDVNEENLEEGYIDEDQVYEVVGDHLDVLDQLDTESLANYVLLTVPIRYFHEA